MTLTLTLTTFVTKAFQTCNFTEESRGCGGVEGIMI